MNDELPVSGFLPSNFKTYVEEAADYLAARGLSVDEVGIVTRMAKSHGLFLNGQPYPLEGWALRIRDPNGEFKENQFLLRVCNFREGLVNREGEPVTELPKFLQTHRAPVVHYCGGQALYRSPLVVVHEKISSAELMWKHLRIPCVAISGCWGWSRSHQMHDEFTAIVRGLAPSATVAVLFDGDVESNPSVMQAAGSLRGALNSTRPDLQLHVVRLPTTTYGLGWDDWFVGVGAQPVEWQRALDADGIDVPESLPIGWLVREYHVDIREVGRAGTPQLIHSMDNYLRLMNYHRWRDLLWDVTGDCYGLTDGRRSLAKFTTADFQTWVERTVCRGYGHSVNVSRLEAAVSHRIEQCTVDMAGALLASTERPTDSELSAALAGLVEGWPLIGRLQGEELKYTYSCMARDMILRWAGVAGADAQWILAIVGPSGCGKSTTIERLMAPFTGLGLRTPAIGHLPKIKQQMDQKELVRIARDNRWALMDDLNQSVTEADARAIFNMLYTLSSGVEVRQREMRQERAVEQVQRAIFVTTSVHSEFIRTPRNTGERRFIVLEVGGRSRAGWEEHFFTVLRAAAHGMFSDRTVYGGATAYSEKYVGDYVRDSVASEMLQGHKTNWTAVLQIAEGWKRPTVSDEVGPSGPVVGSGKGGLYRFTAVMLANALGYELRTSGERAEFVDIITRAGAEFMGKGYVNEKTHPKGKVQKDRTYGVDDMEAFIDALAESVG